MDDSEIIKVVAPEAIRQAGAGIVTPFIEWGRSKRRRQELQADVDAVQRLHDMGSGVSYYRGLAMEMETGRQVSNVNSALARADEIVDWGKVHPDGVSPEFQFRWVNEVRNTSDAALQDLWARILAGEMEMPGSVSQATMSVVRDLTQEVAEEFQRLCSLSLRDENGSPLLVPDFCYSYSPLVGPTNVFLPRLVQSRLILEGERVKAEEVHADHRRSRIPYFYIVHGGASWRVLINHGGLPQGIAFTSIGRELGRVVPVVPQLSEHLLELASSTDFKKNHRYWRVVRLCDDECSNGNP